MYGSQSMVDPLRRVIVRAPDAAFGDADPAAWHYTSQPDLQRAREEHARLVAVLESAGAEVIHHRAALPDKADSIFVHDPVLVCDRGTIVLQMGKELRRGEESALAATLEAVGVPVFGRLTGAARAEGGDLLWVDRATLAVGQGFRTNRAALLQLRELLAPLGVECVAVDLPYFDGEAACLHLMSLVSMIDHDLAVAYEPLLPVTFWSLLRERGIAIIPVPESEFATQGPNVLAMAPRRCLALENNTVTIERLTAAGCEVSTYRGEELTLKAEGGATCLTRPIWRAMP